MLEEKLHKFLQKSSRNFGGNFALIFISRETFSLTRKIRRLEARIWRFRV